MKQTLGVEEEKEDEGEVIGGREEGEIGVIGEGER